MDLQASALDLVQANPLISTHELSVRLRICERTTYKLLAAMREQGLIEWRRQGSFVAGWQVPKCSAWPAIERTLHRAKEVQSIFEYQPRASA
jgi:DNA-binding IclR family transcriptional regulator